ncbi:Ig-like domain-containing protein [Nannocystis bainbridge]|uniref:Ig-like domain-containing protein n=1 Tax=Nannocystis bainbridge TaxID=2995303 RepID=A0ABT5DTH9_9BACT|nr:Ig-like domain-containing protein [Nannocystis bainbridge]MDC0716443.1 Ig-like domain-containing protein [Nannocystis bainbridge]
MNARRTLLALAPLLLAIVAPGSATASPAGPRTLFDRPVTEVAEPSEQELEARRLDFQNMLEAGGLEVHGDVVGPAELFAESPAPTTALGEWQYPPHRATIFLNFFGGQMTNGSNAALMESTCIVGNFKYPGFLGTEAQALAIIETFKNLLGPYGIRVAYEKAPPPELPYAMVMMGGKPGDIGMSSGILGVSCSSDCGDRWWRDTTLAFTAAASPSQTNTLSTTALHEAAHAFGLGHIDTGFNSPFVMHPYVDGGDKVWGDNCEEYNDATGSINCQSTHDVWCGGGAQNTHAELLAYFGTNTPDTEPPTVTIVSPAEDLNLPPGSNVDIEAEISDDHDGAGWKIMIYKDGELVDDRPSFNFQKTWSLSGLPQGVYTVRVQAIDHDRNIGFDEVVVHVGTQAPGTDTESDTANGSETTSEPTTSSSDGSAGVDTSETQDSDSGASDSGAGQAGVDDDGCACGVDGSRGSTAPLVVLGALALRRRRRTR